METKTTDMTETNGEIVVGPTPKQYELPSSIYGNEQAFAYAQRMANMLKLSSFVPDRYKQNVADIVVALERANRMNLDPIHFMQKSYVTQGKVGIEGSLIIALVNTRGGFAQRLQFDYTGDGDKLSCSCWTTDKAGKKLTEEMSYADAKKWGWVDRAGSAWPKMPKQMLAYRTAAFFARKYCPEIIEGMHAIEEIIDIGGGVEVVRDAKVSPGTDELNRRLKTKRDAQTQSPSDVS